MTNNDNRKNCIPAYYYDTGEPLEHPRRELVEVDRQVYEAYYRPIWRVRDKAMRHGGCNAVTWRVCTGDCATCLHHLGGRMWSLEMHVEKTGLEAPDPLTDVEAEVESVRAILAEVSRAGHTAEIRELLQKHGASRLSEVDPGHYEALVADVEGLTNG